MMVFDKAFRKAAMVVFVSAADTKAVRETGPALISQASLSIADLRVASAEKIESMEPERGWLSVILSPFLRGIKN